MNETLRTPTNETEVRVVVKVFGALRVHLGAGAREIVIPSRGTIRDLLSALATVIPDLAPRLEEGLDKGYLNILVNGRNARFLKGLDTPLVADDTVAFLPPIGGG
ncbi:MAG: MoaD/ThiS family protein [Candidatus Bipolaricaulia bacterium]